MTPATEQHKLAILVAEMVDYRARAQQDEPLAQDLLRELRDIFLDTLPTFQGRQINETESGSTVEFPDAFAAVQCALEVQRTLDERNEKKSEERRIQVRIGIHDRDGAERAARMTLLAEPGGICVSRSVFEQIENKVPRKLIQLSESELGDTLPGGEVFKVGELHPQVLQAAAASRKQLGWLVMGVVGLNLLLFLLFGLNRKADQVTPLNGRIVEAACGECQFKMPGKGCDLAVRIDGKSYFVDGFHMDQLGDAHAADGMCNAIRQARVTGQFKDGRFVASAFELLPAK